MTNTTTTTHTVAKETLPCVNIAVLELVWEATQEVCLPEFVESTFRGALGRALRARACVTGADSCDACPHIAGCGYGRVWEPQPDQNGSARFQTPPRPYIITRLDGALDGRLGRGDRIRVQLKLMGASKHLVHQWILAARDAGRLGLGRGRGVLELSEVTAQRRVGAPRVLYLNPHGFLDPEPPPLWRVEPQVRHRHKCTVRVALESPTALTGMTAERFDPGTFTARLLDRLELLSIHHEHHRPVWDIQRRRAHSAQCRVIESALTRARWQRVSQRQGRRVPMEGVVGHAVVVGVEPELVALWQTATDIHVGKKTSFGCGRVRLEVQENQ